MGMTQKNPGANDDVNLGEQISAILKDPDVIKGAASKSADIAADYIRERPIQTLAVAFAAGLIAGMYLGKKRS